VHFGFCQKSVVLYFELWNLFCNFVELGSLLSLSFGGGGGGGSFVLLEV
jgi:hypothetical protein